MATLRLEHWERLGSSARASVSNKDRDILCSKKKNLRKSSLLIKSSAWKNWLLMHIRSHSFSFIFYCTHHTHTQPSRGCGESLLYTTPPPTPTPSIAVKCLALMLDITVGRLLARHQTEECCARDLSYAFWSFLSVSTPLCFPGRGNRPRTILWHPKAGVGGWANTKKNRTAIWKEKHNIWHICGSC